MEIIHEGLKAQPKLNLPQEGTNLYVSSSTTCSNKDRNHTH